MKKLLKLSLALLLTVGLVGCGNKGNTESDLTNLTVSASLDPHEKILNAAKPILKEKYNIDLKVKVLDDYYIFNKALDAGEVDANYFQHRPFFNNELKKGYDIVEAAGIHIEPFGFYSKTIKSIDEIKDGAEVIISNSVSDHGRILGILQEAGLIKLDEKVNVIDAEVKHIVSNPKNLKFTEVKPEMLGISYNNGEGDLVAINGNYALQAKLDPFKDAVIVESVDNTNPYVNIVACQKGHENDEAIKALVEVLKSDEIKDFIEKTYQKSVVVVD